MSSPADRAQLGKNAKVAMLFSMGTKNISLPKELEAYIDAKVESGEYAHASEVVRDGVRLLMKEEAEKLAWLRNAIAESEAAIRAGQIYTPDEVREKLRQRREKS
ncbi:MAG TPA: type II toxin-antitoxin system ParD family antitoxin [Candidatus Acidoferrales bacterium]|nr:type II toxin-antitoxin system ParD family antitoxin [Candidatus Acidoferrales bacterium]